ncbi:unnamed protein product [Rotaria sp. Silwood1]|nr:unnamed protein product [Rotaria sp. Silwood1]CAF1453488.1 unnamed protein product [Rotaria sp. Silwood1]CAF3476331.1 unnamed protein product [Rotaria sp. Silwood1]CAF4929189.1 unnamed protein product [Rotaria sp. Silwood1]
MDGSPPLDFVPPTISDFPFVPLSNSTPSRFSPMTSIGELIGELLTEQWITNISYEAYFTVCAPTSCRYEHIERSSILYAATSLLAIYGGLTLGLRFIVWHGTLLYGYLKNRFRVQPMMETS